MWPIPAAILALLLTLAACTTTPTQCIIHPLAILPTLGQLPFVPVLVQNQPATLMVDTGAIRSVLNMSIVQAAHMTTDQPSETIIGIGGSSDTIATVPSLTIGYATTHDVSFFASRFASRGPDGKPIDGLFGGDFLVNYDLLIDLPAHRVGLYKTEGCAAATFAPFGPGVPNMHFGTPGSSVEFDTRVAFQAELDGVSMPFILDSGSASSLITTSWAVRVGLRVRAPSDDPVIRIGGLGNVLIQARLIAVTKKKTHEPDLLETHWPILLSYVAALLFAEVKGVLDPLVGYVLVLESAIIASKYHPDLIEPGQWRLEHRGGALAIHRRRP